MASIIGATRLLKYKRAEAAKKATPKKHGCYKTRNRRLSGLGYASYKEYLASDDWAKIRARKLFRYRECLLCDGRSSQVHHLDYRDETLLGLKPHALVCLCDGCHRSVEFDADGGKRDLRETNKELRRLAEASKKGRRWLIRMARLRKKDVARHRKTKKAGKKK